MNRHTRIVSLLLAGMICMSAASCTTAVKDVDTTDSRNETNASTTPPENELNYSQGLKYWTKYDQTCVIMGIGTCTDQNVVIPPTIDGYTVTTIGNGAFRNCSELTSIVIPDTVTGIEGGAFDYCTGLTSIEIPDSVTSIGDSAFRGCEGLTSIEIPEIGRAHV